MREVSQLKIEIMEHQKQVCIWLREIADLTLWEYNL